MSTYKLNGAWQSVNTITGIDIGSPITVQNLGYAGDVIQYIESDTQPADTDHGRGIYQYRPAYKFTPTTDIWFRFIRLDRNAQDVGSKEVLVSIEESGGAFESYEYPHDTVRYYDSLSAPRSLVTTLDQAEIATVEGDRFGFAKAFDNVNTATPLYILIENPVSSGVNA